ncbi:nuclear body protein SP140-like protein isoform X1 [Pseudorasbora parva]|uniref:nuclear body protein SP140-like protein isoform X1 n=1 Tax=Pseudorasbora parva TaxID=51549 RepID=UPI00351E02F9
MFLRHLKDYRLITDELYKKLVNCDDAVYDALESIEKRGAKKIRKFWKCVQQEHILQHYSQLSEIAATLKNSLENGSSKKARERSDDGGTGKGKEVKKRRTEDHSVSNQAGPSSLSTNSQRKKFEHVEKGSLKKALKNEPSKKARERSEDGGTGKGKEVKKRRTEDHSVSNQAGPPSSQSTNSQREKFKHVEKGSLKKAFKNGLSKKTRESFDDGGTGKGKEVKKRRTEPVSYSVSNQAGPPSSQSSNSQREKSEHVYREEEKDLWDTQKRWLPVTCGEKKALLDREALRTYGRKNSKCIKYRKQMITPYQYEEMAGKEKSKNWKISVLYQGRKIKDLLKEGFLEMPEKKKKKLAVNDVA